LTVRAIERVEEAVLIVMEERFHGLAPAESDVREHRSTDRVVVPAIIWSVLESPHDAPGDGVERERRRSPFVVTLAQVAVPGGGVAGVPVDEVQVRIVDACRPCRRAAVPPGVARPGLVARLARSRDRVRRPAQRSRSGVERLDEAADAELAAGYARQDHVFYDERRAGDAVSLLPVDHPRLPHDVAVIVVESDQARVHRADEYQLAPQRDAAVVRAAAVNALDVLPELRVVAPFLPARTIVD